MCLGGPQRVFIPSNLSTQNMIACSGGNQVGCFFQPEGILWEQWNSACCLTLGSSMIERFAAGLRLAEMWRGSMGTETQPETYSATQPGRLGASSRLPLLQMQKRLTQPFGLATSPHWGIVWNSPVDGCVSTSSVLISAIPQISIVDDSGLLKTSRN